METFLEQHWLDILTTVLGLIYIWLEYRASIWLWLVGIVMPALDIVLYWQHGLYGDAGMACYYTVAAVYGLIVWAHPKPLPKGGAGDATQGQTDIEKDAQEHSNPPSPGEGMGVGSMPLRLYLPTLTFFLAAWAVTYYILIRWTNSTVPVLDAFTNALSFVGLWALARKYIEQWFFWIVVDAVCCVLYVQKDIPFKAGLYGLYVVIAIMGYFKWKQLATTQSS